MLQSNHALIEGTTSNFKFTIQKYIHIFKKNNLMKPDFQIKGKLRKMTNICM